MKKKQKIEFGSPMCICPRCHFSMLHAERGKPCSTMKCPKCGAKMKGSQCAGRRLT